MRAEISGKSDGSVEIVLCLTQKDLPDLEKIFTAIKGTLETASPALIQEARTRPRWMLASDLSETPWGGAEADYG